MATLTVTQTDPAENETGVSIQPEIEIYFSAVLLVESATITAFLLTDPHNISCPITLEVSGNRVTAVPTSDLRRGWAYKLTILHTSLGPESVSGEQLASPFTLNFTVSTAEEPEEGETIPNVVVVETSPEDKAHGVYLSDGTITVQFNKDVTTTNPENYVRVIPRDLPQNVERQDLIPLGIGVTVSGDTMSITPVGDYSIAPNAKYVVRILAGLPDAADTSYLVSQYEFEFTTILAPLLFSRADVLAEHSALVPYDSFERLCLGASLRALRTWMAAGNASFASNRVPFCLYLYSLAIGEIDTMTAAVLSGASSDRIRLGDLELGGGSGSTRAVAADRETRLEELPDLVRDVKNGCSSKGGWVTVMGADPIMGRPHPSVREITNRTTGSDEKIRALGGYTYRVGDSIAHGSTVKERYASPPPYPGNLSYDSVDAGVITLVWSPDPRDAEPPTAIVLEAKATGQAFFEEVATYNYEDGVIEYEPPNLVDHEFRTFTTGPSGFSRGVYSNITIFTAP